jgi:enoyl-CoA hydratase/carnithine racemase
MLIGDAMIPQRDATGLGRRDFLAASGAAFAAVGLGGTALAEAESQPAGQAGKPAVELERIDGSILLIGINRPTKNRIDPPTFVDLGKALYRLDHDDALRVAVLHAAGSDFCHGIDPQAWAAALAAGPFSPDTREFLNPLGTVPPTRAKPLVVAVQGVTTSVGHELFLAADIRVAASDVRFGQGEVTRGRFPGGGGTVRFVREAGWGNAMRYMLTGDEWDADEARRMGLLQEVTMPGRQLDRAVDIARKIASAAPLGVRATLTSARLALAEGEAAAYAALLPEFARLLRSEDAQEGVRALRENRAPVYKGR